MPDRNNRTSANARSPNDMGIEEWISGNFGKFGRESREVNYFPVEALIQIYHG